ncbi:MAG: 50S ribosomal protein L10 [Desulfurococcales archaeon]|nr:50S ribosomal protein L10 [Desulfurococcales archaeon]
MSMEALHAKKEREIPEWKKRVVAELEENFKKYPVVGIADLTGMPTKQLQLIRKKFRKKIVFKVAKKNLILLAAERAGIDKEKIEKYITGPTMLLFTDMNPFKMARLIEQEKVPIPAKPGQVTDKEIVVPEGDTGITPGPMLSVFGKLRIPYEIRKGTVYIKKDTVVAKPGDTISTDLAGLLQQLGIMPFEVGLKLAAVYDRGVVIPREELLVDLEEVKNDVLEAAKEALGLAAEIVYLPVPEAVEAALLTAETAVRALAGETGFLTPDVAEYVVGKASAEALAVIAALGDKAKELGIEEVPQPVAPPPAEAASEEKEEKKEEEEEKEEEEKEVDLSEGLGGLFGF